MKNNFLHSFLSSKEIKTYFNYFKKGFSLLNQNGIIFFVEVLFTFGSSLNVLLTDLGFHAPLEIIFILIPLNLLSISYLFVPVILFNDLLENKKVTLRLIFYHMKRMFFKTFLLILAYSGLIIIWFGLINPPTHPRFPKEIGMYFIFMFIFIYPVFSYFGIKFAIEGKSFSTSIIESVQFTLKHLKFTYLIIPYSIVVWIVSLIPHSPFYGQNIITYLLQIIIIYVSLVISAVYLQYYRENKN